MARATGLAALLAQRGSLFLWTPVALALGIGAYFALRVEPPGGALAVAVLAGLALALTAARLGDALAPFALGLAVALGGFALAGARANWVAAPTLEFRYYGPVQGRIVEVDRAQSDVPRITLDRVVLDDVAPTRTPARVRLSLQGEQRWLDPVPGTVVILTGHLSPPNGPSEPGDFDFRRMAWFEGLGAVGYTRNPVLLLALPPQSTDLWLSQLRLRLSAAVQDRVAGDAGGLAAAVMTGDRSGISEAANQVMRDSNLYHIVSISGMHMGMLVAMVFGLVRAGVALIPPLALRVSGKKLAAAVALPVAAFYLALAGRDVATERAFVMAAVMLVAILLDRQALTLRSVAIAALLVLTLRPEALTNPGFQMSFAAVTALVAAYQALAKLPQATDWRWRIAVWVGALVLSSLVAGLSTAPFAAAHFNRVAHYGLLANLLATPAMGLLVMPGGVLMAVLGPLGLDQPAIWMVQAGTHWILWVSQWVAGMDGSVSAVIAPPAAVLPLITMGGLFVLLWRGQARWGGLALPLLALLLWVRTERPVLLIADSGGLLGVMTDAGRVLSKPRGDGFAANNWLENDGETVGQEAAAGRAILSVGERLWLAEVAGMPILQVGGVAALASLTGCNGAAILITNEDAGAGRPCLVLDPRALRDTGAIAGHIHDGRLYLVTVAEVSGHRLWTGASPPPPSPLLAIATSGKALVATPGDSPSLGAGPQSGRDSSGRAPTQVVTELR